MPNASSACVQAGVPAADIERIHAPIGLDIGAQGAAEIALSDRRRDHRRATRQGRVLMDARIAAIVLAAGRSSRMSAAQ